MKALKKYLQNKMQNKLLGKTLIIEHDGTILKLAIEKVEKQKEYGESYLAITTNHPKFHEFKVRFENDDITEEIF